MTLVEEPLVRLRRMSESFGNEPETRVIEARRLRLIFCLSCGVIYFAAGMWLISKGDFLIGDAAYRTANARTILFSRDPHLAAIGMVWMPLSTLSTLPFTALFEPVGFAWAAGAAMSAAYGAGFAWAMTRMASHLCPSSAAAQVVVAVTLLNPVTVFWMGSGMMEAPSLFFLAWAILSWLRWTDTRDVRYLSLLGIAIGLGFLTRYEQLFVAVVFVLLVGWFSNSGSRRNAMILVAAPTICVGLVWLGVNLVIKGDPFAFIPEVDPAQALLPVEMQLVGTRTLELLPALWYAGRRILHFAPAVLCTPIIAVVEHRTSRWRPAIFGASLAALSSPIFVGLLTMSEGKTTGNPRYFLNAIVIGPLFALAALSGRIRGARPWSIVLCIAVLAGSVTAARMELSVFYTGIEHEEVAISRLTGLAPKPLAGQAADELPFDGLAGPWKDAAREIDAAIGSGHSIATDSSSAFLVLLFTDRPDQFVIPEDRDFEQLLSLNGARFDYVFVRRGQVTSQTGINSKLVSVVDTQQTTFHFEQVGQYPGVGELWKRVDDGV